MSSKEYLKKINIVEMRLYELLGIKLFRRAILLFERIKHINDGGQNENYHPHDTSNSTLLRFSGFLIYNSLFHIASLMLIIICFVITEALSVENVLIDVVMVVVTVLNVYCLMLQRYIYLRLRQHVNKKRQNFLNAKTRRIAESVVLVEGKSSENIKREIAFLQELKTQILSGQDVVLTKDDEQILLNIASVIKEKEIKKENNREINFKKLINKLPTNNKLISTKQYRVSRLQNVLRFEKKNNVLFGVCVVTDNFATEVAYQKVFPNPTLDSILDTIEILLDAYNLHRKETVLS